MPYPRQDRGSKGATAVLLDVVLNSGPPRRGLVSGAWSSSVLSLPGSTRNTTSQQSHGRLKSWTERPSVAKAVAFGGVKVASTLVSTLGSVIKFPVVVGSRLTGGGNKRIDYGRRSFFG